jgi:hypothetical protein
VKTEEKVWNLTDHPDKGGSGHVIMVAGCNVQPGHAVKVPLEVLATAKRLKAKAAAGEVYIGATPPEDYLLAKNRRRAVVPRANGRTHGLVAEKGKVAAAKVNLAQAEAAIAGLTDRASAARDLSRQEKGNQTFQQASVAAEKALQAGGSKVDKAKKALAEAVLAVKACAPKSPPRKAPDKGGAPGKSAAPKSGKDKGK